jgi:hypothetical protein
VRTSHSSSSRTTETFVPLISMHTPHCRAFLQRYKETLESVIVHGTIPKKETKIQWFEYSRLGRAKLRTPLSIAIPEIATHNHAYFDRSGILFHQTAPAMKLQPRASEGEHFLLTAILNSSAALFWLKQVCFNKGSGEDEEKDRFVYAGRKLEQLPVPVSFVRANQEPSVIAVKLVDLARRCDARGQMLRRLSYHRLFEKTGEAYDSWNRSIPGYTAPHELLAQPFETLQELLSQRARVREQRDRLRGEMIALQEEMDWLVYVAYGLLPEGHPAVGIEVMKPERPWRLSVGQRPFELMTMRAGPPSDWEEQMRVLWVARLEVIRNNESISRIEHAAYKRRWVPPDYDKEFTNAFNWWLREHAEFTLEHLFNGGPVSLEDWTAALWKLQRIRAAVHASEVGPQATVKKFEMILKDAVDEEAVPDNEADFKPHHKKLRGKLNVPRERFLRSSSRPDLYIWAGKAGSSAV